MDQALEQKISKHIPRVRNLTVTSSLISAVTTEWKVKWSADAISRDLFQNFFDASKGDLRSIVITASSPGRVLVYGKEEFNVTRLYFLGSEKSAEAGDIGGFGEGFKGAAVALLRDFNTTPVVVSGKTGVAVTVADEPIPGTQLRPLHYHFFEHDGDVIGTYLFLDGSSQELTEAMKCGRDWFFSVHHPGIAGPAVFENATVAVYPSTDRRGLGFYRGHLRIRLDDMPVVIHFKTSAQHLETLISSDRDRRMFEGKAATRYFNAIAKGLLADGRQAFLVAVREKLAAGSGHPLLESISDAVSESQCQSIAGALASILPRLYVVGTHRYLSRAESEELEVLTQQWANDGRRCAPGYFWKFGVQEASRVIYNKRLVQEDADKRRAAEQSRADEAMRQKAHRQRLDEAEAAERKLRQAISVELQKNLRSTYPAKVSALEMLLAQFFIKGMFADLGNRNLRIELVTRVPDHARSEIGSPGNQLIVLVPVSMMELSFADAAAQLLELFDVQFTSSHSSFSCSSYRSRNLFAHDRLKTAMLVLQASEAIAAISNLWYGDAVRVTGFASVLPEPKRDQIVIRSGKVIAFKQPVDIAGMAYTKLEVGSVHPYETNRGVSYRVIGIGTPLHCRNRRRIDVAVDEIDADVSIEHMAAQGQVTTG
jgi:hypothetical protein